MKQTPRRLAAHTLRTAAAFACLAACAAASAQTAAPPATLVPQIYASGTGELRAPPDLAVILLAVETTGTDAARVGRDNAVRMASLRQGLEKAGIPTAALSTVGYSIRNDRRLQAPRDTIESANRFVARNGIRVMVTDLERVGTTIDAALASGANQVDDVSFRIADEHELRRKALTLAVAQARAQADAMAIAAGGRLGALIELGPANLSSPQSAAMFSARVSADTPVSRAELTLTERVVARWRFVADTP